MQPLTMYQVDAFADRLFSGNPAAVLVLDRPLDVGLMQAIAAENNLAETAFVLPDGKHWAIRWFTPLREVAFCGHATLASAHVLHTAHDVAGPIRLATAQVGPLTVRPGPDGRYDLDLPCLPPETADPPPDGLDRLFPAGHVRAFRNFENLFVELPTPDAVTGFDPDLALIARVAPMGLAITAAGGQDHAGRPVDFISRYFAPGAGIDEDPATGSTHSTLVPYWSARLGRQELAAFQASRRGGAMTCRIAGDRVILTAGAVTFMKATIYPG